VSGIDPRAVVSPQAELAADVTVGAFSVIEAGVRIGAGTWVGPHAVIKGPTTIGAENRIFQFASIGDAPQDLKYKGEPTRLEIGDRNVFREFTTMGGYSGTHQFTKVGAHAFIGNNAAVTRDVPPYVMAVGTPAVPHSINSEGLKRRGFSPEQIRNLKNAYRVLYRSDMKLADAVAELSSRVATQPELKIFVDFIGESTRSLVR
jgi:UDP-N-acetylglucosamine acyltransferase